MTGVVGPEGARGLRWRAPALPKDATGIALSAALVALLTMAATFWVVRSVLSAMTRNQARLLAADVALYALASASALLCVPAARSVTASLRGRGAAAKGDIVEARVQGAAARTYCFHTYGYAATVALVCTLLLFVIANDVSVGKTFFRVTLIRDSFRLVLHAFGTNVFIFCVAEVLILAWGLLIAIARLLPGRPAQPIRLMATIYTDVFRGLPAIVTIYLVGFGLSLADIPGLRGLSPQWYAILALTLTYGAYVAEVYRAGIESIHPSQAAAARSLGLSFPQTLAFVIVPQAVRRIIPPLLNDFIGLQKDTALVNVIGVVDTFNQAKIIASNHFSLSPVTTVALLFVLITIPQARLVDRLIARDQRRMRAAAA